MPMGVTCTNREGQVYHLHTGKTKAGKPRWFMSTKSVGELADAIPEGYEIWEKPENAQVFLRKIITPTVTEAEVQLIRDLARRKASTRYTIVDVRGGTIVVHAADDNLDARSRIFEGFGDPDPAGTRRFLEQQLQYHPMLRFELEDETDRLFSASRWCFLGSIDDWFLLDGGPLAALAAKYIPHIGAESFYELM